MKAVFFDKDGTMIVEGKSGPATIYPLALACAKAQKDKGRSLYITTAMGNEGRDESWQDHLRRADESIDQLFDGLFGFEELYSAYETFFVVDGDIVSRRSEFARENIAKKIDLLDGEERRQKDQERIDLEEEAQGSGDYTKVDRWDAEWEGTYIDKRTGNPVEVYQNPYQRGGSRKDLFVAKYKASRGNPDSVHAILIGDNERRYTASDPSVPCLEVYGNSREDAWRAVGVMTDTLLSGVPAEVYDNLHSGGVGQGWKVNEHGIDYTAKAVTIDGLRFRLDKNDTGRVVVCTPDQAT